MAPELRYVGRPDAVPRTAWLPGRGARSSWPWPIEPGLVRKRHGRVCRRSGSRDRGPGSQGHHDGGPLDWRRRSRALHRTVRHEAARNGGQNSRRAAAPVEICGQSGRTPHRSLRQLAERPGQGPLAGLRRLRSLVLWRQQTWCAGVPRHAGSVLALEHAGRPQERVRQLKAFSETDFTEDLKKFDIPTLVMHGEDDQIVPVKDSAKKSAKLIKGAAEIYYPGLPHGLTATHADLVNRDLLAFCQQGKRKAA